MILWSSLFLLFSWLLSHVQLFETSWTAARQASLSFAISWSLLILMSIESVMPINHLILCCLLLLLPSIFPSISGFSNELALCIRWPKYWSFSFSISFQWIFRVNCPWDWLVWPPHHPKDSQEFSLAPHFKSINSEALGGLRISLVPDFQNTILIITQAGNKIIQASLYFKHYTTSPLM